MAKVSREIDKELAGGEVHQWTMDSGQLTEWEWDYAEVGGGDGVVRHCDGNLGALLQRVSGCETGGLTPRRSLVDVERLLTQHTGVVRHGDGNLSALLQRSILPRNRRADATPLFGRCREISDAAHWRPGTLGGINRGTYLPPLAGLLARGGEDRTADPKGPVVLDVLRGWVVPRGGGCGAVVRRPEPCGRRRACG